MSYVLAASAAVTAGLGIYKTIKGANDSADAKRRAKLNIRPTYDIAPEYFANQGIASNLAQGGLPDSTKNYYETNAERGLGSSLGAMLQTGGGVNSIGDLYDRFDQNNRAIAAADAQQKIENIKNLMAANNQLADQKTQKWVLDKYQPYLDTAKSIAGEKAQGQGEVNEGLNTVAGAVSSYAGANAKQEDTINTPDTTKLAKGETPGTIGYKYDQPALSASSPTLNIPDYTPTSTIPSVTMPQSYDDLNNFNTTSRQVAINNILNKYKDSPYYGGLNSYLQPQAA